MGEHRRLLMVGVDHQALEALDGDGVDVTVLMGEQAKDIGMPVPGHARVIFVDDATRVGEHRRADGGVHRPYRR